MWLGYRRRLPGSDVYLIGSRQYGLYRLPDHGYDRHICIWKTQEAASTLEPGEELHEFLPAAAGNRNAGIIILKQVMTKSEAIYFKPNTSVRYPR